jgi:hypothetical protein
MANPLLITIPINVWTKVATGVNTAKIYPLTFGSGTYMQTVRDTTDPAPTNGDLSEAVQLDVTDYDLTYTASVDLYIAITGAIAGKVRVDL